MLQCYLKLCKPWVLVCILTYRFIENLHDAPTLFQSSPDVERHGIERYISAPARSLRIFDQRLSTRIALIKMSTGIVKPGLKKSQHALNIQTLFVSLHKCKTYSASVVETVTQCCVQMLKLTAAPPRKRSQRRRGS